MDGILSRFLLFITSFRSTVEQETSSVVQWFRNHCAMQWVRIPSLVRELNPTSVGQLNLSFRKEGPMQPPKNPMLNMPKSSLLQKHISKQTPPSHIPSVSLPSHPCIPSLPHPPSPSHYSSAHSAWLLPWKVLPFLYPAPRTRRLAVHSVTQALMSLRLWSCKLSWRGAGLQQKGIEAAPPPVAVRGTPAQHFMAQWRSVP